MVPIPARFKPPQTHTEEEILRAVDRLGAGLGSSTGRWGTLTLGRAQDIVRDAVRELTLLRQESREWICTRCKLVYPSPDTVDIACPQCATVLRPAVVVTQAALLGQIREAQIQISKLEDSIRAFMEFGEQGNLLEPDD